MTEFLITATTAVEAATAAEAEQAIAALYAGKHDVDIESEFADEDEQACRVCGCTNERACDGGCTWAETDLCSTCDTTTPEDVLAMMTYQYNRHAARCQDGCALDGLVDPLPGKTCGDGAMLAMCVAQAAKAVVA